MMKLVLLCYWIGRMLACSIHHTERSGSVIISLVMIIETYNFFKHLETGSEAVITPMMLSISHLDIGIQGWRK